MRDEDRGDPQLPDDLLHLDLHLEPQLAVERAEWLIQQQHARLDGQRSSERHTLLLATRQLVGIAIAQASQVNQVQHFLGVPRHEVRGRVAHPETERHVLLDSHVREQRIVLEYHTDLPLVGR